MVEDRGLEYFCENIKNLRAEKGLSKKEMAKILGIGVGSLTQLEAGKLPPRLDCGVLERIHKHFGIIPAALFRSVLKSAETKTAQKGCKSDREAPEGVCDTPSGHHGLKT